MTTDRTPLREDLETRGIRTCPVFHVGRCGSTVLQQMLLKHGAIFADTEIYGVYAREVGGTTDAAFEAFTRERVAIQTRGLPPGTAYLFEVKFFPTLDLARVSYDLPSYLDVLIRDFGTRDAIVLERRNVLRRIVSTHIASSRGRFFDAAGAAIELPRIALPLRGLWFGDATYDLVDLIAAIEGEYAALRRELAARNIAPLSVTYEDDIEADPGAAYAKVCRAFGVAPVDVAPRFSRINTAPLSRTLSNFDAVAAALAGTPYAWMLGEVTPRPAATAAAGSPR
ncbi:hypothetical protein [Acuticoccus sp. I52.16.1]|uniref:hypothetical protein n=1 Tax=Acuticoccus sp. I52.16.1 TaxID=2928472 RepID=UPI001FD5FC41|nr:hypothetical protein [Acuticoccus sp. I52.16.1]UOM34279.1 hypothetical protein MRB58_21035 [Acuticoccus sp. I52.16.1]